MDPAAAERSLRSCTRSVTASALPMLTVGAAPCSASAPTAERPACSVPTASFNRAAMASKSLQQSASTRECRAICDGSSSQVSK